MWESIVASILANIAMVVQYEQAKSQERHNMALAEYQAEQNAQLQAEQNAYNTPAAQMQRFQDARLNPNLIYGQGTPGNQPSVMSFPDIRPTNFQYGTEPIDRLSGNINQSRLTSSQIEAQRASIGLKEAQTELSKLQAAVVAKNPALDDAGYKAMIDNLIASAELKKRQSTGQLIENQNKPTNYERAREKINREIQLLDEKFGLATKDKEIKAQILKSKEFQNEILDVQKRFMTDGDITPQHIVMFVQMLLMKALK